MFRCHTFLLLSLQVKVFIDLLLKENSKIKMFVFDRFSQYYMQPMVVLKLGGEQNATINMKCAAWSSYIKLDLKKGYGSVRFSIKINT
jgi:hypothetical protein